jgi:hypothetical protein
MLWRPLSLAPDAAWVAVAAVCDCAPTGKQAAAINPIA